MSVLPQAIARAACVLLAAMCLSACKTTGPGAASYGSGTIASNSTGSGSGGGTGTGTLPTLTPTTPPPAGVFRTTIPIPAAPSARFSGNAVGTAEGIVVDDITNITISDRTTTGGIASSSSRTPSLASFSTASALTPNITNAIDATPTADENQGSYDLSDSRIISRVGSDAFTIQQIHGSSHYGIATQQIGNRELVAGFHGGSLTPAIDMPTTGQANYLTTFIGRSYEVGSRLGPDDLIGVGIFQADFASGEVTGLTSLQSGGFSTGYNLRVEGRITGNTFLGSASFPGTVTSSSVSGGFYGQGVREVAGALRLEGTPTVTGTPTAIVGGFGGVIDPNVQLDLR